MTNNPPSTRIQPGEYGFPLKLKARYDNFIGGDWVAPADGDYYQNLTPVTGQPLCEIASSGKRDIDLALDAAHKAKDKWGLCATATLGAVLLTALPEVLRSQAAPLQQALFGTVLVDPEILRQLFYGLALVGVMLVRPSGIWPVRHKEVKA
jgi:hypothetical protein